MPLHLLHVGFPKAGATFFKAWCAARDDVAFAHGGVGGHASPDTIPTDLYGRDRARLVVTSSERLVMPPEQAYRSGWAPGSEAGDAVQAYADVVRASQEQTCDEVAALFPSAHVLILVRGFRSMLRSMVSQGIKAGVLDAHPSVEAGVGRTPSATQRMVPLLHYDAVVGRYERAFGAARVTVLPYELLRDDREAFVRTLCAATDLPYRPFDPGRLNPSLSPHAMALVPRLSRTVRLATRALPGSWSGRAFGLYQRQLLQSPGLHRALDRAGRVVRAQPVHADVAPEAWVRQTCAGLADGLADRPHFAPYGQEYLWGDGPSDAARPRR